MKDSNPYFDSIDELTRKELKDLRAQLAAERKQARHEWCKRHAFALMVTQAVLAVAALCALSSFFLFITER